MPIRICSKCGTKFETTSTAKRVTCPACLEKAQHAEAHKPKVEPKPLKPQTSRMRTCSECGKAFATEDPSPQAVCPECKSQRPRRDAARPPKVVRQPPFPGVNLDVEMQRKALARFLELKRAQPRLEGKRQIVVKELGIPFEEISKMLILYYGTQSKGTAQAGPKSVLRRDNVSPFLIPEIKGKPTPTIPREAGFQIEKAYFKDLEEHKEKRPWRQIVESVCQRTGQPFEIVAPWLNMLHSWNKGLAKKLRGELEVPPAVEQQVVDLYSAYLRSDQPPEVALHTYIGGQLSLSKKLVHAILLKYRLNFRREHALV